jgi:hypothetical protein
MDRSQQGHNTNPVALTQHEEDPSLDRAARVDGTGTSENDGSKFVFLDVSMPGSMRVDTVANTRLIHQHAMKEIGRSRRRPKKNPTIDLKLEAVGPWERPPRIAPWLGHQSVGSSTLDPFVRFPIELDANAHRLVAHGKGFLQRLRRR